MRARDVMTREVVAVRPETSVREVAELLLRHRVSAMPVVSAAGEVLGIVSEGDIMRRPEQGTHPTRHRSWWLETFSDPDAMARDYRKRYGLAAKDVMTESVVTVGEETDLAEIAKILEEKRIKRVPVVREGKLVGIVSRSNLLQGLVSYDAPAGQAHASDQEIRKALYDRLKAESWSSIGSLNIVVADGVVHLWGFVRSEDEAAALKVAAETQPGVAKVVSHLAVLRTHQAL